MKPVVISLQSGSNGNSTCVEAAQLPSRCGKRLEWACLAHLSEQNNAPDVALETHRRIPGGSLGLRVAGRYAPTDVMEP